MSDAQQPTSTWTPIAHNAGNGVWIEYDDAPISIGAAFKAAWDGRGFMAQRRVPGGFDLVWKGKK